MEKFFLKKIISRIFLEKNLTEKNSRKKLKREFRNFAKIENFVKINYLRITADQAVAFSLYYYDVESVLQRNKTMTDALAMLARS